MFEKQELFAFTNAVTSSLLHPDVEAKLREPQTGKFLPVQFFKFTSPAIRCTCSLYFPALSNAMIETVLQ
jgi:hypothetical protein